MEKSNSGTIEKSKSKGVFSVYEVDDECNLEELKSWMQSGHSIESFPGTQFIRSDRNILMSSLKLAALNTIYGSADHLVITNQTSTPVESETSYSGTIYSTVENDEFFRSLSTNPIRIAWIIGPSSGIGTWGSYILVDSANTMINRALTGGVTKSNGQTLIVEFQGSLEEA